MTQGEASSAVQQLRDRLEDPAAAASLLKLLDGAAAPDSGSRLLASVTAALPDLVATLVDTVDEKARAAGAARIDLTGRGQALVELLELATRPDSLAAVRELLAGLPRLAQLAELAGQAPDLIGILVDTLDDHAATAAAGGLQVHEALTRGLRAALWLGSRISETELQRLDELLQSGLISAEATAVIGRAATALVDSQRESGSRPAERIGPFGLIGALRDPQLQKTLAFAVRFARSFGRHVGPDS